MKKVVFFGVVALLMAGCGTFCGLGSKTDAEGFTYFNGDMPAVPPSDYFILRFERPDGVYDRGWNKGMTRWIFTEVRQLKSGTTIVRDGVLSTPKRKLAPCNWAKWISAGSRNVRVKFVDADYTLPTAGRKVAPQGFTPMFNGRDFAGWKGVIPEEDEKSPMWRQALPADELASYQKKADASMQEHWFVRDGVIFFDGLKGGTSIATCKNYGDFEMFVDWRLLRVYGDSGFYLRAMAQVQIWDPNTWGGQGSGGLWNNEKGFFGSMSRQDHPIGDWNTFRMRMIGDKVTVWLNDVKVVDNVPLENCWNYNLSIPMVENIQLQCHGDPVEFRNLFIREL